MCWKQMLDILTVLLKPPNNNFSAQAELHDRLSWCEGSAASSSQPHVDWGPNPRPLNGILCPKTRSIRILIGKKSHPGDRSEHSENLQVSFPLFLFYFLYFILFLDSKTLNIYGFPLVPRVPSLTPAPRDRRGSTRTSVVQKSGGALL